MANSGMTARDVLIQAVRERDKRKYGKWITHNTARGDVAEMLGALSEAGFVIVPKSALDWLNGEGPDENGNHFGDDIPVSKRPMPFWWRSKFRALIAAAEGE